MPVLYERKPGGPHDYITNIIHAHEWWRDSDITLC